MRRRKDNTKAFKAKLIAATTLKITPMLVAIALGGNYVIETLSGEFSTYFNKDKLQDTYVVDTTPTPSAEPDLGIIYDEEQFPSDDLVTDGIKDEPLLPSTESNPNMGAGDDTKIDISSKLLDEGFEFDIIDFEGLEKANPDTVAWVSIPGTNIQYPIVQGDDNSYYLNHDFENNETKLGAIYMDSRQTPLDSKMGLLNDITIVYGHNFSGQRMFNELCKYKEKGYYEDHSFGVIYTPDGYAYAVDFFAGVVIDGSDDSALYRSDFEDEEEFESYIANLRENSKFKSDIELDYEDKIVALVTCSYETNNSRFVLYGKLGKQYTNENQIDENMNRSNNVKLYIK